MLETPGQLQRGRSPSASRTRSAFDEDCTIVMASFPLPSKLQESVIISTESDVVVDRGGGVERFALVVVLVGRLQSKVVRPNNCNCSLQGVLSWRASGDRQISLSASDERAFANFRVKNVVFTGTHFCAVVSMVGEHAFVNFRNFVN